MGGHRTPWLSPSGRRGKNKLSEETNLKPNAAVNVESGNDTDKIVVITLNRTSKVKAPSPKSSTTKAKKMAPMILDRKLELVEESSDAVNPFLEIKQEPKDSKRKAVDPGDVSISAKRVKKSYSPEKDKKALRVVPFPEKVYKFVRSGSGNIANPT